MADRVLRRMASSGKPLPAFTSCSPPGLSDALSVNAKLLVPDKQLLSVSDAVLLLRNDHQMKRHMKGSNGFLRRLSLWAFCLNAEMGNIRTWLRPNLPGIGTDPSG